MSSQKNNYICYCLKNYKNNKTYVGITNNWRRRKRQHNGELKGGARYTRGGKWSKFFHVKGFKTKQQSLQFEWAMKHRRKGSWLTGRCKTLWFLLGLERWTKRAPRVKDMCLSIELCCSKREFLKLGKIKEKEYKQRIKELPNIKMKFQ